jgi:hypothetical protein
MNAIAASRCENHAQTGSRESLYRNRFTENNPVVDYPVSNGRPIASTHKEVNMIFGKKHLVYGLWVLILTVLTLPQPAISAFFENPVNQVYEAQKQILKNARQEIQQPEQNIVESQRRAADAKREAESAAEAARALSDQQKIAEARLKEIEALRRELREKDLQIEEKNTKIGVFKQTITDFEAKNAKTGEAANDYLIVFSTMILSLIGNILSWTRFIINRKKVKLEEHLLSIDLEIKKKELENLSRNA